MLSDEERMAIEHLKNYPINWLIENVNESAIKIILNLIEKQSKEIEELKAYKHDAELTKVACCTAQNCEALNNCIKLERELQNADKKWKDKIKAKTIEIKNRQVKDEFITASQGKLNTIIDMESLLEKE